MEHSLFIYPRRTDLACMRSKVKIGINLPINLKIVLDNA